MTQTRWGENQVIETEFHQPINTKYKARWHKSYLKKGFTVKVKFNLWKRERSIFKKQGQNLPRQKNILFSSSVLGGRMSDLPTISLMPRRVIDA